MNVLYCKVCGFRTPRNFADEDQYNGVFCEQCAVKLGYTKKKPAPPTTGSSVQKPIDIGEVWNANLKNLSAGTFGDPTDPETLLRYWKRQEAAGYPGASENVKYFQDILDTKKEEHDNAD